MPTSLVDAVQLNVTSPARALPGIDNALKKLQALDTALRNINAKLGGLSDATKFERSAAGIERVINKLRSERGSVTKRDLAAELGFKPAELEKAFNAVEKNYAEAIRKARTGKQKSDLRDELKGFQSAFKLETPRNGVLDEYVKSTKQARDFILAAQKEMPKLAASIPNLLGMLFATPKVATRASGNGHPSTPAGEGPTIVPVHQIAASLAPGNIPLLVPTAQVYATLGPGNINVVLPVGTAGAPAPAGIPAPIPGAPAAPPIPVPAPTAPTLAPAQVVATLAPGHIPLLVPVNQVVATLGPGVIPVAAPGTPGAAGAPAAGAAAVAAAVPVPTAPTTGDFTTGGELLSTTRTVPRRGAERIARTYQLIDQEVTRFYKQTGDDLEQLKEVLKSSPQKKVRDEMRIAAKLMASSGKSQTEFGRELAEKTRQEAEEIRRRMSAGAAGSGGSPRSLANVYRDSAQALTQLLEGGRGVNLIVSGQVKAVDRLRREALALERRATQIDQQTDARERASRISRTRRIVNREVEGNYQEQKRQEREAKAAAEAADKARRAASIQATQEMSHAALRQIMVDKEKEGYKFERSTGFTMSAGQQRRTETFTGTKEEAGKKFRSVFDFEFKGDKEGTARLRELDRALKDTRAEASAAGRDFLKNTLHVTTWAASVGLLYGALGLVKNTLKATIETGFQAARLTQVFSGIGGSAQQLTNDVLELAAANGRSSQEAMQSAVQWSRLGLSRVEVNQAVRVSLMAANVAEMSAAESTEHLSAIMMSYKLNVFQLGTVLAELNSVSNHYNVTNKDLLTGIGRVSAVARQAGLPLQELIGIMGATVGSTGQTGANIGNAIKSLIVGLSNPALQKVLRDEFKIEVTVGGGGDVKNMSEILSQLFVQYNDLTKAEQQHFLVAEAGKTQAARVAAILDTYLQGQALAVQAQLDLNSAEKENKLIKETLKAQLQSLATEWERFANIQSNRGFTQTLSGITQSFRNLLTVANAPYVNVAMTGFLTVLTAVGAKLAITALRMKTTGEATGFFANTANRVRQSWAATVDVMDQVIARSGRFTKSVDNFAQGRFDAMRTQFQRARDLTTTRGAVSMGLMPGGIGTQAQLTGMIAMQRSFGMLNGAIGAVGRTLALFMATVRSLGIWFLAIGALTYGFNRAMEGLGLSSDSTQKKIGLLRAEAEKFTEAAKAAEMSARAFHTAGRTFETSHQPEMSERIARQVAPMANQDEIGKALQPKNKALEEQTLLLLKMGDFQGAANLMYAQQNRLFREGAELRQKAFEKESAYMEQRAARIDELEKKKKGGFIGGLFDKGIQREQDELKRQQSESLNTRARALGDEQDDLAQRFSSELKYGVILEQQKKQLEGLAAIYNEFPAATAFERATRESSSLASQLKATAAVQETLNDQGARFKREWQGFNSTADGLKARELSLRQEAATLAKQSEMPMLSEERKSYERARVPEAALIEQAEEQRRLVAGFKEQLASLEKRPAATSWNPLGMVGAPHPEDAAVGVNKNALRRMIAEHEEYSASILAKREQLYGKEKSVNDMLERRKQIMEEIEGITADLARVQSDSDKSLTDMERIKALKEDARKRTEELIKQKSGIDANLPLASLQARFNLSKQMAEFRGVESDVGETEAEKSLNRRVGLERDAARLREQISAAAGDTLRQDSLRVQLMTQLGAIEKANLDVVRLRSEFRQKEVQRAIDLNRELQRSLLMGGPEELLKNLAAFQLTGGGKQNTMGLGQFLTLDSSLKQTVSHYDSRFDPEMRDIRQARNRLGPDQGMDEVFSAQQKLSQEIAELTGQISIVPSSLNSAADGARQLANAAANAALYLLRLSDLPGIIDSISAAAGRLFSGRMGMHYDLMTPVQGTGTLGAGVNVPVSH